MLKDLRFIIKSLTFYKRQYFPLLAAAVLSSAVLTGALIVGDSVKYSLKKIAVSRLGKTGFVVSAGSRFFSTDLALSLESECSTHTAPVLMLQGLVIDPQTSEKINKVKIIGIDNRFGQFAQKPFLPGREDKVIVNRQIAERLKLRTGDDIVVRVENTGTIPVNAPFAREREPSEALRLTIEAIADDDMLGRFNLSNEQSDPYNIFISHTVLAKRLDLNGLSNVILLAKDQITAGRVKESIRKHWTLRDLSLQVKNSGPNEFDLRSDRVFIDSIITERLKATQINHKKILTYLVNEISAHGRKTPYSFASSLEPFMTDDLKEDEVIANQWLREDLDLRAGDSVTVKHYEIGPLRELKEVEHTFRVKSFIPTSVHGIDSTLMPSYPGLSDAGDCSDWETGIPIDLKHIRDKDENYWDEYRGSPKLLLPFSLAEKLWKNRFGTLTALRFNSEYISKDSLAQLIPSIIKPEELGFTVTDVLEQSEKAVANAIDFSGLFLGLSFFIIVAALLLIALLFTLHWERRTEETAILKSLGFSPSRVMQLRITESMVIIIIGCILGSLAGILYNFAILKGLNTIWSGAVQTGLLSIRIKPVSILTGAIISIVMSLIPVYVVVKGILKQPVAGKIKHAQEGILKSSGRILSYSKTGGYLVPSIGILILIYAAITDLLNNAGICLLVSALFIIGGILFYRYKLGNFKQNDRVLNFYDQLMRNIQMNPTRSLTVITILAIGTFTVMITGANRKTYYGSENNKASGTGGYLLWAETTSVLPFNLNLPEGKEHLTTEPLNARFVQMSLLNGDDASCLNLNQAQKPALLAVDPDEFDSCGAFTFSKVRKDVLKDHPWLELNKEYGNNTYPVFADQTVIQYGLKMKLGDTLKYTDEKGMPFNLVLIGGIGNSVFQGYILLSRQVFNHHFPSTGGTKIMLVSGDPDKSDSLKEMLQTQLTDYGIEVESTAERLAAFNAVENTYLSVFMALSGLGFIIGTIGLGILILRNMDERRQELAVLTALGFTRKKIFIMVFAENIILFFSGIMLGLISAGIGILPSVISPAFTLHTGFLIVVMLVILCSGLLWIYFPLRNKLRYPLIPALRKE